MGQNLWLWETETTVRVFRAIVGSSCTRGWVSTGAGSGLPARREDPPDRGAGGILFLPCTPLPPHPASNPWWLAPGPGGAQMFLTDGHPPVGRSGRSHMLVLPSCTTVGDLGFSLHPFTRISQLKLLRQGKRILSCGDAHPSPSPTHLCQPPAPPPWTSSALSLGSKRSRGGSLTLGTYGILP